MWQFPKKLPTSCVCVCVYARAHVSVIEEVLKNKEYNLVIIHVSLNRTTRTESTDIELCGSQPIKNV